MGQDTDMAIDERDFPPESFGDWQDAEALRRWSFTRRTPQQRLDWMVEVLSIKYQAANARAGNFGRIETGSSQSRQAVLGSMLGSALAEIAAPFGGLELDIARDAALHEPSDFE